MDIAGAFLESKEIIEKHLDHEMDKARLIRELVLNLPERFDIDKLVGEDIHPLHGLYALLSDFTKGYDNAIREIEALKIQFREGATS